MKYNKHIQIYLLLFCIIQFSCKKYLDAKSDQSLATPSSIEDFEAILNNSTLNKGQKIINSSTDEYYLRYNDWTNSQTIDKDSYNWNPALDNLIDWYAQYSSVFYANTVLDQLPTLKYEKGDELKVRKIMGSALFLRAHAIYQLAQLFAPQYDPTSASQELGIPLRTNSDFNVPNGRATVQQTYTQILNDLSKAISLLPDAAQYQTQPSKSACLALLARVNLQIGDFKKAKDYAAECLNLSSLLLDFNSGDVSPTSSIPIKAFNKEVIFYVSVTNSKNSSSTARVDSTLFSLFEATDIRKKAFFNKNSDGSYRFKGSYNGGVSNLFNGLATDEVYLIRAECLARENDITEAMKVLNILLAKRHDASFTPLTASTQDEALSIILKERKKELIYRGLRWSDLRRLNKDARFSSSLFRQIDNVLVELKPNDLRYTLLIPKGVIELSGIEQNKR
jgi:hypothetical protein